MQGRRNTQGAFSYVRYVKQYDIIFIYVNLVNESNHHVRDLVINMFCVMVPFRLQFISHFYDILTQELFISRIGWSKFVI